MGTEALTPETAVRAGYTVIRREMVPRGTALLIDPDYTNPASGFSGLIAVHPLDFIALAWPDLDERLTRTMGYLIDRALARFDTLHPEAAS